MVLFHNTMRCSIVIRSPWANPNLHTMSSLAAEWSKVVRLLERKSPSIHCPMNEQYCTIHILANVTPISFFSSHFFSFVGLGTHFVYSGPSFPGELSSVGVYIWEEALPRHFRHSFIYRLVSHLLTKKLVNPDKAKVIMQFRRLGRCRTNNLQGRYDRHYGLRLRLVLVVASPSTR